MSSFNESKASFSGSPEKRSRAFKESEFKASFSFKEFLDNEIEEINQAREEITDQDDSGAEVDYQAGFKEFLDALKSRIENAKKRGSDLGFMSFSEHSREIKEKHDSNHPPYIMNAKVRTQKERDEQILNQKYGLTPSLLNWYYDRHN